MQGTTLANAMADHKEPRIARLLGILLLLRAKEWVPASDLSSRFNVSVRTIYRDIEFMQAHSIPIQGSSGPERGYRLEKETPVDSLQFDSEDAMALYLHGTAGTSVPDALTRRAGAILSGVSAELRPEAQRVFDHVRKRVYFDTTDWYWRDQSSGILPQIREAVLSERTLCIRHHPRGTNAEETERIRPYGLVWKGGEWYLVGQGEHHGSIQRIRLARIIGCESEEHRFEYPNDFNLRAWWVNDLEQFGKGTTKVCLRGTTDIRGELLTLKTKESSLVELFDDGIRVTLFVDRWDWLVPLILSYGTSIYVEEPIALRDAVRGTLERALGLYDSTANSPTRAFQNDDSRRRATRGRPQRED
jgi:predicted DNA-binding transcriptional regulator YafY